MLTKITTTNKQVRFIPFLKRWVAVGRNSLPDRCVIWSDNGVNNWKAHTGSTCSGLGITTGIGICYGGGSNGVVLVVGQPGNGAIMSSPNGTHYTPRSTGNIGTVNSCAFSPQFQRFVAVGSGTSTMLYSNDMGATWTSLGAPNSISCVRRVVWMFDKFVAVGNNGPQIITSSNGLNPWNNSTALPQAMGATTCGRGLVKHRK